MIYDLPFKRPVFKNLPVGELLKTGDITVTNAGTPMEKLDFAARYSFVFRPSGLISAKWAH